MRANSGSKVERRRLFLFIAPDVLTNLRFDGGQIKKIALEFVSHPDASKVSVTPSIPEPPSHLQQRVIRARSTDKKTCDESLESETARQNISPDDDEDAWTLRVVETLFPQCQVVLYHH